MIIIRMIEMMSVIISLIIIVSIIIIFYHQYHHLIIKLTIRLMLKSQRFQCNFAQTRVFFRCAMHPDHFNLQLPIQVIT